MSYSGSVRLKTCSIPTSLCSFDIKSLFTLNPMVEVIKIYADPLHDDLKMETPVFTKNKFIKLMEFNISFMEFRFDGMMQHHEY